MWRDVWLKIGFDRKEIKRIFGGQSCLEVKNMIIGKSTGYKLPCSCYDNTQYTF